MAKQNRNTLIFIGFLLLAGFANFFSRTAIPAWDTLMMCGNYLIYIGLLLFWAESVRIRLLPSKTRTYMIAAAFLMLFYMLVRIYKYRISAGDISTRYAIYAYWIPQILIPPLFFMTCISICRGEREKEKWDERLLLIPGAILSLAVMTNDFLDGVCGRCRNLPAV